MKKLLGDLGTAIFLVVVIVGSLLVYDLVKNPIEDRTDIDFGGQSAAWNQMESFNYYTTSTGSFTDGMMPVKLLERDADRVYALIINDSSSDIYVYATSSNLGTDGLGDSVFDAAATSSLVSINPDEEMSQSGIRVVSDGGAYEILPDNLVIGYIWATSTAGATKQKINVIYK